MAADGPVVVTVEPADSPDAIALIEELESHLAPQYPPTSRHGFSVDRLLATGVVFAVVRVAGAPAGCGGILFVPASDGEPAFGELKRMYVRPAFRGRGLGHVLIEHLAELARARGLDRLRLETGIHQRAAIALYERAGFRPIGAFPPYRDDPLSRFYERATGDGTAVG